jgi:nucleoside-diphosphate-sugar epimerase
MHNRRVVWVFPELARGFCTLADGPAILCRYMGMYNFRAGAAITWNGLANLGQRISSCQLEDRRLRRNRRLFNNPWSQGFEDKWEPRMKLLIAGGAGYLGSVLIPRLLDRGYDIDVVELFWFGNQLPSQVGILNKDIFHLTVADLQTYDQVIFLAGLSNDPMAEYSPSKNFILNAAAPAYLGYIAKVAKVKRYIYASSCSVYGYTENELYDETRPVGASYPYGISKLQGEQAALQLTNNDFSVICLRKGTISGYSPRMRLDLIVNTMFKSAMRDAAITVNNPSIWRPVLSITDAATAYIRAIEASAKISGVFNLASGNYTVGEVADVVRSRIEERLDHRVNLVINHVQDFRNYKVSTEKAANVLSFHPTGSVRSIVDDLIENMDKFRDWDNPLYSNIHTFKMLDERVPAMSGTLIAQ